MTIDTVRKQEPHFNLQFRLMAAYLSFRERFRKPEETLKRIGLTEGHYVLDFRCGIGRYSLPASRIVGENGQDYALDIHPMAIDRVSRRDEKTGITNLRTILSGVNTELPNQSVDFVLMFDVFHCVQEKEELLKELHRVLADSGKMFVLVDHITPEECKEMILQSGLFVFFLQEDNLLGFETI